MSKIGAVHKRWVPVMPTRFLQTVVVLIGIGALVFMLWEPHLEGRNANATLVEIYFKDPFLAYVYIASIPFFIALYQALKALGYVGKEEKPLLPTLKAVRTIKHCAIALIGFVVGGEMFILFSESDDRAGGVFMGILIALGSIVVATAAVMVERKLKT